MYDEILVNPFEDLSISDVLLSEEKDFECDIQLGYNHADVARDRKFFFVVYPDSDPDLPGGYDCGNVIRTVENSRDIKDFAYVLHNKDYNDQLEHKKDHIHLYFDTFNKMSLASVSSLLGVPQHSIFYAVNKRKCCRYLLHLDHPDKFLYDWSCVVSNFDVDRFWGLESAEVENQFMKRCIQIIDEGSNSSIENIARWAIASGYSRQFRQYYPVLKLLSFGGKPVD